VTIVLAGVLVLAILNWSRITETVRDWRFRTTDAASASCRDAIGNALDYENDPNARQSSFYSSRSAENWKRMMNECESPQSVTRALTALSQSSQYRNSSANETNVRLQVMSACLAVDLGDDGKMFDKVDATDKSRRLCDAIEADASAYENCEKTAAAEAFAQGRKDPCRKAW